MLDLENGIESLTNFKRNTADYLQQLHQTGTPLVLTVNGRAEVVVQDAVAYQRLLERAAKADLAETVEAIREGLADSAAGRVKPARKALQALAKKYGISNSDDSLQSPADGQGRVRHRLRTLVDSRAATDGRRVNGHCRVF